MVYVRPINRKKSEKVNILTLSIWNVLTTLPIHPVTNLLWTVSRLQGIYELKKRESEGKTKDFPWGRHRLLFPSAVVAVFEVRNRYSNSTFKS